MRNYGLVVLVFCMGLLLAACDTEEQALPTLRPLPTEDISTPEPVTEAPTDTPIPRPTLPPTWTPTPTETPETAVDEQGQTLATPPAVEPVVPAVNTISPACDAFLPDLAASSSTFIVGTSPIIAWTPVEGAAMYWIVLSDQNGLVVKDDIFIAETTYTFAADLFTAGNRYGWSVRPLNAAGIQMCYERGSELTPFVSR